MVREGVPDDGVAFARAANDAPTVGYCAARRRARAWRTGPRFRYLDRPGESHVAGAYAGLAVDHRGAGCVRGDGLVQYWHAERAPACRKHAGRWGDGSL